MSPIGRVFIVLNLILAGTFVGFAGTHLQKNFNWKSKYETLQTESSNTIKSLNSDIDEMRAEVSTLSTAKSTLEQQLASTANERDRYEDDVKRLTGDNKSLETDVKKLTSEMGGLKSNADAAFNQAKDAYQASVAAMADKDEAIRARDAAQAENRDLKNQIAALEETGQNKDVMLADAKAEQGRLKLLVDVAKAKGFLESMAVPQLAGTVSNVTGNLCTVLITDNPTSAEVVPGYSFAIYDASGYKAEARVTSVDSARNAAFCTLDVKAGDVREGDKASTHLAGL